MDWRGGIVSTNHKRVVRSWMRHRRRFRVRLDGYPASITTDVGGGGFCVEVMQVLAPGTSIHGTVLVGNSEHAFVGTVAWARSGDPRLQLRGRMGVRFSQIPQEFELALAALVATPMQR